MAFPAQVLQQAQYDASIGGKNMPKNAIQRAQSFLRSKLMPGAPTPNPSTMTSQQQTAFDAKQGGRLLQEFNKTRSAAGPVGASARMLSGLATGGLVGANLAGLNQINNIIKDEGGYGKLGERMLGLITRTDGIDDFNKTQRPNPSGTKIKIGDKLYDTGYHSAEIAELRKKNPGGGNAAQSTTTYTPPATGGLDTGSGNRDAKLDPNATEQYASNFKAGQANMDQIQDMYSGETKYKDTDKTALQLWAKANPALAQKEFAKAETRALKPGGELYGYDTMDTFKPIDIPEADRQNPIDQATALGGNLTIDAQTFADKKIEDTMAQIRNEEITDMSLSDTLNLDIPSKLFLSDEDKERLNTGFDSNSLPLTGVNPSGFDMKGSFPQPDIAPSLYGSFATVDRPYLMK